MHARFEAALSTSQANQFDRPWNDAITMPGLASAEREDDEPVVSADLQTWTDEQYANASASILDEIRRGVPWSVVERRIPRARRTNTPSEDSIAMVVAETVDRRRQQALVEVALHRLGNPPLDQVAQLALPSARHDVEHVSSTQLAELLDHYLGKRDADRKRLADAPTGLQREALAWALAKEQTEHTLARQVAQDVTRPELEAATARTAGTATEPQAVIRHPAAMDVAVLDINRRPIAADEIFNGSRGDSPFTLEEWCSLPTRPIVMPTGKPGPGADGLATFLFDKILYSKQVCDRNGQAVGLSQAKRDEYLGKIRYSIEQGLPITASEYLPLVAISNPIKRNTQAPDLAEIDVMRCS